MNASDIATAIIAKIGTTAEHRRQFLEGMRSIVEALVEETLDYLDANGYAHCRHCSSALACAWCEALDRPTCGECGEEYCCPSCGEA